MDWFYGIVYIEFIDNLFYFCRIVLLIFACLVVTVRNPVISVLCLVAVYVVFSYILVILGLEFLALIFLIVYVGAIMVLFLFIVMLLNIKFEELKRSYLHYLPVGLFLIVFMFVEFCYFLYANVYPTIRYIVTKSGVYKFEIDIDEYVDWVDLLNSSSDIENLGFLIYTNYFVALILIALILLIAMMGSIVLTFYRINLVKKQNQYEQLLADYDKRVKFKV